MTTKSKLLVGVLATVGFISTQSAVAQPRKVEAKVPHAPVEERSLTHPLEYYFPQSTPSIVLNNVAAKASAPVARAEAEDEASSSSFYGLVKQGSTYNVIEFAVEPETTPAVKKANLSGNPSMTFAGAVYYSGKLYTVTNLMNMMFNIYEYDVNSWIMSGNVSNRTNPYAVSFTANQADKIVYGSFTNATGSAFDFGTYDMKTAAKTVIAALSQRFVAIAADNAGAVYGIAVDGNLYSINPATGAATVIGSTGQTVGTSLQSATIDSETGRMYWAAGNNLYAVDTTTGAATLAATIGGDAISDWTCLYTIPFTAGSTPEWVSSLKAVFEGDTTNGTVSFILPSVDTSGATLTNTLEYHILVDDKEVASGSGQPGTAVSEAVTVSDGTHKFSVYTVNNSTKGLESYISLFVGHDTPCTPAGITVAAQDNDDVVISWEPVIAGVSGAYVDVDAMTYRVVRQPGNIVLAEAAKATSITDSSIEEYGFYTYEVTATDGKKTSEPGVSDRSLLGFAKGVNLPYSYEFDDVDGFGVFHQVDANEDGWAWKYDESRDIVWFEVNPNKDSDDWLISPGLNLEKGMNYCVEIKFTGTARLVPHYFDVCYGTSPDIKDLKHAIITKAGFVTRASTHLWFNSEVEGLSFIGIRVVTPAVEDAFMIESFGVTEGYANGAPAQVLTPKAVAAPNGARSATISFDLPKVDFSGKTLQSILAAKVVNTTTGNVIEVPNPAVAGHLDVVDENPAEGNNDYVITSYTADGESLPKTVNVWVGPDFPGAPLNVQWVQTGANRVRVSWNAPEVGQHGGYIVPSDLKYLVMVPETDQVITNNATETELEFDIQMDGTQTVLSFGVCGINDKGLGVAARSNESAYGAGIKCPFFESFEGAALHSTPWMVKQVEGYNSCNIVTDIAGVPVTSYDDEGMAVFTTLSVGSTRFETPLLDLSNLENPALKMWVYFIGPDARFVVRANDNSGTDWTDLMTIPNVGSLSGWHLVTVPLDKYAGSTRMQLGLEMFVDNFTGYYYVLVDKISIIDNPEFDMMMINMEVPERVNAGEAFPSSVTVVNGGFKTVDTYTINAIANGTKVASKECGPIEPDEVQVVELDVPLSSNATSLELIMGVECDGDDDPSNDAWISTGIQVMRSRYPQPVSLINRSTDNDKVELEWTEPASIYQASLTDDMESLEHGSVGGIDVKYDFSAKKYVINQTEGKIGPYKVVDNDQMLTTSTFGMMGILPHDRDGMACQVINLHAIPGLEAFSSIWAAHSGGALLCFWQSRTPEDNFDIPNDDWLILPRLAEDDPRISFWAKSLTSTYGEESFEIMVSMDGDNIEDFVSYQNVVNVPAGYSASANAGYTFYEFELPEGTQYVAIHYNAGGTTALLIDDLTYTPADNYQDLTLLGYNVYRNGVKINKELLKDVNFTDTPEEDGDYLYNVTTVFAEGESRYSNTVRVTGYHSSVEGVSAGSNVTVTVNGHDIVVKGAEGSTVSLYGTDGRLLDTRNSAGSVESFRSVSAGAYVVRAGASASVVIVK